MLSVKRIVLGLLFLGLAVGQNSTVHFVPMSPGGVPQWASYTVANSGSNFLITKPDGTTSTVAKAAATTQSVSLFTLPAGAVVQQCVIKSGTAFTGTTTLTATVGITGSLTGCVSVAYDMKAAVSVTNFGLPTVLVGLASFNGTDAVILALTSTIDNLSSISAGSVTLKILWAVP